MLENYIKKNVNSRVVHTLVVYRSATQEGINYTSKDIKGHRDYSKDLNGNGKINNFEVIKEYPCFDIKSEYKI